MQPLALRFNEFDGIFSITINIIFRIIMIFPEKIYTLEETVFLQILLFFSKCLLNCTLHRTSESAMRQSHQMTKKQHPHLSTPLPLPCVRRQDEAPISAESNFHLHSIKKPPPSLQSNHHMIRIQQRGHPIKFLTEAASRSPVSSPPRPRSGKQAVVEIGLRKERGPIGIKRRRAKMRNDTG